MTRHPQWDRRNARQATTVPPPSQKILEQAVLIHPWTGGLNNESAPDLIDIHKTPYCKDVYFFLDEVRKAHSSVQIGGAFTQAVYWWGVWERENGALLPVALAADGLYYFLFSDGQWHSVTGTAFASFTISATEIERFIVRFWDDVMYFGSDNNALRSWDGVPANNHVAVAGGFTMRGMMVLNDHLILATTRNAGVLESQTYRFTQSGSISFAGVGSGTNDLSDSEGTLQNVAALNPFRGLAYKTDSIVEVRATGDASAPFENSELISGLGLLLPYSLVPWAGGHFFVGTDENIYNFNGSALEDISGDIRTIFFNSITQSRPRDAIAALNRNQQEYIIFLPSGTSGYCKEYYAYNYTKKRWRYGWYDQVLFIGEGRTSVASTVVSSFSGGEAVTQSLAIGGAIVPARYQTYIGTNTKKAFRLIDAGATNSAFDSTALQAEIQTMDFTNDGKEVTLTKVRFGYISGGADEEVAMTVDYSTDGGATFSNSETVLFGHLGTVQGTLLYAYSTKIVTGNQVRVRLRNSDMTTTFRLRSITPILLSAEQDRPGAIV